MPSAPPPPGPPPPGPPPAGHPPAAPQLADRTPVPLPRRLANPWPVVTIGVLIWLVGAVVVLIAGWPTGWVWTCLAGSGLGLIGLATMALQRNAARRGSKSAQQGLL